MGAGAADLRGLVRAFHLLALSLCTFHAAVGASQGLAWVFPPDNPCIRGTCNYTKKGLIGQRFSFNSASVGAFDDP
jgi:hypothetical protein